MNFLTIITPTYNREKTLTRLYHSLKEQSCGEFRWLIVDDGSTDRTRALIENFRQEEECGQSDRRIEITYIYQENGGKHTALNRAINEVDSELIFIVDSDDYLPNNAVAIIKSYHEKFKSQRQIHKLCGYSFLRCHADGRVNTAYFPVDEQIDSYRNVRINGNIGGDKAEVFYTDILKQYSFPVFEGERFLPEDIVWMQMSGPFNMVHINENIYTCDYLEGGLTRTGRGMKIYSPRGMILRSQIYLNDTQIKLRVKIKMMLLYIIYGKFAHLPARQLYKEIGPKFLFVSLYVPALLLKLKWR